MMGISIMWDKPWTWNMLYCWWDYPNHHMDQGIWWYYMVELSFYWSLLITQFFDVKRKVIYMQPVIKTACKLPGNPFHKTIIILGAFGANPFQLYYARISKIDLNREA